MSVYPPPTYTEYIPVFNTTNWETFASQSITTDYLNAHYLKYPVAQGLETLNGLINLGTSTLNGTTVFGVVPTSTATQPSATDSSTKMPTTAWVQSAITAGGGGGGITPFTITSNAVGTNSWTFTIPNSYGRAFTYSVYSDTTATTATKSGLSIPMNYGTVALNGSFIFATGSMVYQPYQATSVSKITYCSGFSQNYTITAGGGGYIPSVINTMGQTITWSITTSSVGENTVPCPPVASGGFTTIYTITSSSAVASCYLKLVGIVVAS